MRPKLEAWSEPESVFNAWKQGHDAPLAPLPYIDEVIIEPVPDVDPRRISYLVESKAGQVLDTKVLGADLKRIYALGLFEIVSYSVTEEDKKNVLRIKATTKSWGPTYLRLGLALGTDFQFTTEFGVVGLVDATELNRLGGRWKTTFTVGSPLELKSRFYQPLNYEGHVFASPYGAWRQQNAQVFLDQAAVGTYQVSRGVVGFDLGYDFGTWGELRFGYLRAFGKGTRKVGDPIFPNLTWDEGALATTFTIDQLDNVNLPHAGYLAKVEYLAERESLGGTQSYDYLNAAAVGVQTIGRWTGLARVVGGSGLGTNIPFYDQFFLGGLFRLSGRPAGQLTGNTYGLGSFLLYYRLSDTAGLVLKNMSVGVSIETGRTWQFQEPITFEGFKLAGSVYVVADTILGPLFVGYGHSGSNNSAYLTLNRSF